MSEEQARTDEGLASRMAAVEILYRVDQEAAYADVLLGGRLPDFAPADRRLITRLVLGTLAWRGRLDYELAHLTGRKLDGIQPAAVAIMRMGLFQLRYLDRIPQHAVVDTAVSMAKRIPETRKASGFVNAVMRRATRETAPMPPRDRNEKSFLAVAYSHPRWMVERFVEWFGVANAERLMTANNDAAPNVIRLNLARGSRTEIIEQLKADGFETGTPGRAPETLVLGAAPHFESRAYREGLFHAQSEASQMAARMLAPRAGATVVDCAAAPGGKATHLAEMIGHWRTSYRSGPQSGRTQERTRADASSAASERPVCLLRPGRCRAARGGELRLRTARRAMHRTRHPARASGDQVAAQADRSGANGCDTIADAQERGRARASAAAR